MFWRSAFQRVSSVTEGRVWWPGRGVGRDRERENACTAGFLHFVIASLWNGVVHVQGVPSSVAALWKHSHRHTQRCALLTLRTSTQVGNQD
jgi:hypothetical protein